MNLFKNYLQKCLLAFLLSMFTFAAYAGPGHDTAGDKGGVATASLQPRFYMESELYEAVGMIDGAHINLYLDGYSSNKPVVSAQLELKINDQEIKLTPAEGGFYLGNWDKSLNEKPLAISLTIRSQDGDDILAATLEPNEFNRKQKINWSYWVKVLAFLLLVSTLSMLSYRKRHQLIPLYTRLKILIKERI